MVKQQRLALPARPRTSTFRPRAVPPQGRRAYRRAARQRKHARRRQRTRAIRWRTTCLCGRHRSVQKREAMHGVYSGQRMQVEGQAWARASAACCRARKAGGRRNLKARQQRKNDDEHSCCGWRPAACARRSQGGATLQRACDSAEPAERQAKPGRTRIVCQAELLGKYGRAQLGVYRLTP